jgi:F0F1-type ATP synthase assembly protein I
VPLNRRDQPNQIVRAATYFALFSEIGFVLAIPILIGILVGDRIDRTIGSWPIFLLVGALGGMALGGYASYRLISRFLAQFESEPRATGDRRDGSGVPE